VNEDKDEQQGTDTADDAEREELAQKGRIAQTEQEEDDDGPAAA
jgi:hypothetical protein